MRIRLLPDNPELGWLPYTWLVFLGFFLVGIIKPPITPLTLTLNIAGLLVFLVAFFRSYWIDNGPRLLKPIAVCVALGVGLSAINPGALVFFHYSSFFAGRLGKWQYTLLAVLVILAVIITTWYLQGYGLNYLLTAAIVSIALAGMSLQIYSFDKVQKRLFRSETEVKQLATIAERERIARDLHDVVGHTLSVITLKSELAQRLVPTDSQKSQQEMQEIETIARRALKDIRKTVAGYKHLGLQQEIKNCYASLLSANIETSVPETEMELPAEYESALIMVLREATTNVIRHSNSNRCAIALSEDDSRFELTVHDNGVGYRDKKGNGINGMMERIAKLGGHLSVSNRNGTLVAVTLPKLAA